MIADSTPWKDDLLRVAAMLEKRKAQVHWTERTSFLVERDVMISAYAIRKLVEARKLSDEFCDERVPVHQHSLVGKPPDIWNRHEFWEHYDLDCSQMTTLSLTEFCNQVIHSWLWVLSATDEKPPLFDGIYVSSDRERKRSLYFVKVDTLIDVFRSAGMDDIVHLVHDRDKDGVMHVTLASREYPKR